jgi:hypothetical protein
MKSMKKVIFCVLVCMLMILGSVVPLSGTIVTKEPFQLMTQRNTQYDETEKIFNDLKLKLDKVTTKQETLVLVNEAIVELHEHGLLPKGMTLQRAQRVATGCFSKSDLSQPFQSKNENNTGNTNCLVIGMTNHFIFRPYPTIWDIPIMYYLLTNSSLKEELNVLFWFYAIRYFNPLKFGPFAFAGLHAKQYENGNLTHTENYSVSGWVWTIGMNGVKKWDGTFYGGLYTRYTKYMYNNHSYTEAWDPIGIKCFVGIQPFCFLSSMDFDSNRFYIGFAREVNFTYSPPWP